MHLCHLVKAVADIGRANEAVVGVALGIIMAFVGGHRTAIGVTYGFAPFAPMYYLCAFSYTRYIMTSSTFTVRIDASQIKRLEALAESTGRSRSYLAADAINAYLDVNEWQVAGIKKAIASMDANGGVALADVKAWVGTWNSASASRIIPRSRKS